VRRRICAAPAALDMVIGGNRAGSGDDGISPEPRGMTDSEQADSIEAAPPIKVPG